MRSAHESFLLTEARQRLAEGERRAKHAQGLAELRRSRPTLRRRTAELLVSLAYRLSSEVAPSSETVPKSCVQA